MVESNNRNLWKKEDRSPGNTQSRLGRLDRKRKGYALALARARTHAGARRTHAWFFTLLMSYIPRTIFWRSRHSSPGLSRNFFSRYSLSAYLAAAGHSYSSFHPRRHFRKENKKKAKYAFVNYYFGIWFSFIRSISNKTSRLDDSVLFSPVFFCFFFFFNRRGIPFVPVTRILRRVADQMFDHSELICM